MIRLLYFILISLITLHISGQNNYYDVNTERLYRHGYNSGGVTASENIDSVTTTAVLRYFILPDATTNPSYDAENNPLTSTLSSSFAWNKANTSGTADGAIALVTGYAGYTNYKQVTFSGTGTMTLSSLETSAAGCASAAPTTINIEVIARPTIQFSSTSSAVCRTQADGSVNYSLTGLPLSWTSSVAGKRQLKVNISISCSNAGFGGAQTFNNVLITETGAGTATIDCPIALNYYGLYTITLTQVNDRIGVKSSINGTIGASNAYTFLISRTPVSGAMLHVPNQ